MRHLLRTPSVLATCFLTAGIVVAGEAPKEFQYLEGDVAGIAQNAIGVMDLESATVLTLRGPETKFDIPYAAITKSQHKVVTLDDKEPLYKVWALGKRLMPQLPVEIVTLQFVDKSGKASSVTLEMYQTHVDKIMGRIQRAEERRAINSGAFWGDRVWKTKRNQDSWVGEAVASRE